MNSSFILVVEFSNAFFKNGALKIGSPENIRWQREKVSSLE
jgi:hypothetical protein